MSNSKAVQNYRDPEVYKAAMELQQAVFVASKAFPKEETYSLTDQVRRSSRSIGANLAEAWAKRRCPAHFLSKLTHADGELQETLHWLRTARLCDYLTKDSSGALADAARKVGGKLCATIATYESFCISK